MRAVPVYRLIGMVRPWLSAVRRAEVPSVRRRPSRGLHPGLECFEARKLPSTGATAFAEVSSEAPDARTARPRRLVLFRITNPTPFNTRLVPPFDQVAVQSRPPVPGRVYNVFFVSVRNQTRQTFDASDGFAVRLTNQTQAHAYPILTGEEQWTPNEVKVFYVLTKKYYPVGPITSAGFQFKLGKDSGIAIPGPSGIFLRVRYNPATFPRVLDRIVAFGPGARGRELGLPDTAIWAFGAPATAGQML